MTTTWSFLFFVVVTAIAFMLAPFVITVCVILALLVIIGAICRWNVERRERPHVQHRDSAPVVRRGNHPV